MHYEEADRDRAQTFVLRPIFVSQVNYAFKREYSTLTGDKSRNENIFVELHLSDLRFNDVFTLTQSRSFYLLENNLHCVDEDNTDYEKNLISQIYRQHSHPGAEVNALCPIHVREVVCCHNSREEG